MIKDNLRRERNRLKYTQKQLADLLNVSQQTVGSWEVGRTEPDSTMLKCLSEIFGVSIDYLTSNPTQNNPLTQEHLANTYSEITKNLGEDVQVMFHDITTFDEEELEKLKEYIEFIKSKKK